MSDGVENKLNAYVAGLRQLLDSVEPILRQANSLATVQEILLNLEATDENFHKYDLIRMLREQIEDELGPLIENAANETGLSESDGGFTNSGVDEVLTSEAFSKVSNETINAVKSAANEIIKSMVENGGNLSMKFSSSDRYQRFPNRFQDSQGDDSYLASSFDGDDFMFMAPNKYSALANQLLPESNLAKRLEALNILSQVPQTDLINSEFWAVVKKGLSHALKDDNHILAERSLKFHAKMFATASGHVIKEIYTSLTEHLMSYFKDPTSHMVSIESGLDLGDRRNLKLLKEFRLLNQFQHDLPLGWIRYPEKLVEEILQSTTNLLAVIPQPASSTLIDSVLTPYNFLSLMDPSAFWFCKWMHGNYSRAELLKHLSGNNKIILKEACRCCLDFLLHVKTKCSSGIDDEFSTENRNENGSLYYSKDEILCLNFIQSLNILGRIILYKEGRALFPIELDDGFEIIAVSDLVVMLVEVISFLPPSSGVASELDDLEPSFLATSILKNLATASLDTCMSCICKDVVTNALLQPVQKYLDGYIGTGEMRERYEVILTLTADVLAVIASTQHGRYQLLYGEKQERWQRSRLAPVHTIGLFTKKALSGTLEVQPTEQVVCAFLFVCRQLYNTCEGLMIMNNFSHSDYISKALMQLREPNGGIRTLTEASPKQQSSFTSLPSNLKDDVPLNYEHVSRLKETRSVSISSVPEIVTEEDLFGSTVPVQNEPVTSPLLGWKYANALIDNLLNFTSTPKGVLLVAQTGSLDECAQYMNSRYQQNLQVSKIEKFGYGVMMVQISATAPGMVALEKAGYFSNLLENIWMCLEGCTNDYTKTVLSSDWDDFEDKQCKKFFTSLVNLLSAFPSVFELLNIEPRETRQQEETELSETSLPVTSENTFQVPETFEELLQNLVFIESSERMRLLFRFERSHFFGLRVISSLVSCLDTFLLMQSKFRFQESLLRFQESQKLDNGDYIIDNCSVERNQILVRTYSIGGPTERTIPPRNLTTDPRNPYPWPMFSSYPMPAKYFPHDPNVLMTAFEQQDEVGRFLTESTSNSLSTSDEARSWLTKCREIYLTSLRKDSNMVGMKSIARLMQSACKALSMAPEEAILPLVEYSGNEALLKNITLSEMDEIGLGMVMRYGNSLRLIPPTHDKTDQLRHLIKKSKYFFSSQQRQSSSHLKTLQAGYPGFDWFISSIYLIMGGKVDSSWEFLSCFSTLLASGYLWTARLHASIHLPEELQKSGIHPMYSTVCHNLELVLQAEIPQIYSAFRMSGYPPSQICQLWLRQCFFNFLDWREICNYICCCLVMGVDYQIYFCMAVLKHLQRDIFFHAQQKDLSIFLREQPIKDFSLGTYVDFITELEGKYRKVVLPDLQDITKP